MAARLSTGLDQPWMSIQDQDPYRSTRPTRKAVSASTRPSPARSLESSRARLLASSSQSAPTMRYLRCGRTRHPWAARCAASATTSRCDGNLTRTTQEEGRTSPTFPALAPDGLRAQLAARLRCWRTACPSHPASTGSAGSSAPSGRRALSGNGRRRAARAPHARAPHAPLVRSPQPIRRWGRTRRPGPCPRWSVPDSRGGCSVHG